MMEEKTIKRSHLNELKKKFDSESEGDIEFLKWFERNQGIGYRAGTKYKVIED